MAKFRKKPVEIEAVRWTGDNINEVMALAGWFEKGDCAPPFTFEPDKTLTIETLEGDHTARVGDWIIRGVKGEFYPCKPDIFALTYEAVDRLSPAPREAAHEPECPSCAALRAKLEEAEKDLRLALERWEAHVARGENAEKERDALRAGCARVEQERDAIIQALGHVVVLRVPTPEECVERVKEIRAECEKRGAALLSMSGDEHTRHPYEMIARRALGLPCSADATLAPKETP